MMIGFSFSSSSQVFKNQADKQGSRKLKVELSIYTDFEIILGRGSVTRCG
jgi:hypothetical protein